MNLKIKLTKYEYVEFCNHSTHFLEICRVLLDSNDYLHYYNIRTICKNQINKYMRDAFLNKKKYSLTIGINEFNSFKYIFKLCPDLNPEAKVIIQNIIHTLDKQILDINHTVFYNAKETTTNRID